MAINQRQQGSDLIGLKPLSLQRPMISQKKIQFVKDLTENIQKAKSLVLADYSRLSVPQQEELRKKLKSTGAKFIVVKNTLLKLALQTSTSLTSHALISNLSGPTALMMAFEDELAPIKILVSFSEEFETPQIKAGFFEGSVIKKELVIDLAKMPNRDQLMTQLAGLLNSPFQRLANDLTTDIRKLLFILKIREGR